MSAVKIECSGCGYTLTVDGEDVKCPNCGTIAIADNVLTPNDLTRLSIASGYRRVGRFDDAQEELENLLTTVPDMQEALFECFLNAYEVTEYTFDADNNVQICKCSSTSSRPVNKHADWIALKENEKIKKLRLKQWSALSERIEKERVINKKIKESIPEYRAILTCDVTNDDDLNVTEGLYNILCEQTDVFFAPVSLNNIDTEYWERYLLQVLKNPEIAPLMFVIYSNAFNYRNKAKKTLSNIAAQCREFAKTHTKQELFSVTCDYEPSPIMKRISIKTIRCADFDKESYENIADAIMRNIVAGSYNDDEYDKYYDGEIVMLNEDLGLSPIIEPIDEK